MNILLNSKSHMAKRENLTGLLIVVPIILYTIIFTIVPVIMLVYYSFTDYGFNPVTNFVGFAQFAKIFKNTAYIQSFISTFIIAFAVTGLGIITGFLLAVLMNAVVGKGKNFIRVIWYIPGLISMAIMSQFINFMITPSGAINRILEMFSIDPIIFKRSAFWMYFFIIGVVVWKGMGGTALLFVAALNGISKDVYEAAEIDGAGRFKKLTAITMPLIRPMFGFILITGFIGAMGIFEPVMLISQGEPGGQTKVILYQIYTEAFGDNQYAFACALSLLVTLVTLALTFINIRFSDSSIYKFDKEAA